MCNAFLQLFISIGCFRRSSIGLKWNHQDDGSVQRKEAHRFLREPTLDVGKDIRGTCNSRKCVTNATTSERSHMGKTFGTSAEDGPEFLVSGSPPIEPFVGRARPDTPHRRDDPLEPIC